MCSKCGYIVARTKLGALLVTEYTETNDTATRILLLQGKLVSARITMESAPESASKCSSKARFILRANGKQYQREGKVWN